MFGCPSAFALFLSTQGDEHRRVCFLFLRGVEMALPEKVKNKISDGIRKLIFERAWEIEQELAKDNYFLAKITGVSPEQVESVALEVSLREYRKIRSRIATEDLKS